MSVKYHVNPDTGESGVCRSEKGKCPFRGESGTENHYSTAAEAQAAGNKILLEDFGMFPTKRKTREYVDLDVVTDDEIKEFRSMSAREEELTANLYMARLRATLSLNEFRDKSAELRRTLDEKDKLTFTVEVAGENVGPAAFGDQDRVTINGSNADGSKEFEIVVLKQTKKSMPGEIRGLLEVHHLGTSHSRKLDKTITKIFENQQDFVDLFDLKRTALEDREIRDKVESELKEVREGLGIHEVDPEDSANL